MGFIIRPSKLSMYAVEYEETAMKKYRIIKELKIARKVAKTPVNS